MEDPKSKNYKHIGEVSFNDNKVRVEYKSGTASVLFEDISSIGYIQGTGGNIYVMFACFALAILLFVLDIVLVFSLGLIVLGLILPFVFPYRWENVQIETKGGKVIAYSVPSGKGKSQMELIERTKREILSK